MRPVRWCAPVLFGFCTALISPVILIYSIIGAAMDLMLLSAAFVMRVFELRAGCSPPRVLGSKRGAGAAVQRRFLGGRYGGQQDRLRPNLAYSLRASERLVAALSGS